MNSPAFQLNKVRRLLATQGVEFIFNRSGKNEFNEPNGTTESFTITGVYHETTSYLSKTSSDASTIRQKPSPMILTTWAEAEVLKHEDTVSFNHRLYRVGDIHNVAEANIIADISIEEIQQ